MTLNGCLAGLVAITAPCAFVSVPVSVGIGLAAGAIVVLVPFPVANFRAKRRQMLSMHALTARRSA